MSGGKGGTTVESPDPLAVAGLDFAFNRFNQLTPYSNLNYYAPGQRTGPTQQVGFNQDFLTNSASQLFSGLGAPSGTPASGNQVPTPTTPNVSTQQVSPGGGQSGASAQNPSLSQAGVGALFGGNSSQLPELLTSGARSGKFGQPKSPGGITIPTMNGTQNVNFSGLRPATAVQTLSPAMLALENARTSQTANTLAEGLRRQNEVSNGALPSLISSLNTSGLGQGQTGVSGIPNLPTNPDQFRSDTINAMYQLGSEPLNRDFNRNLETVEQRLANQGLALGGEAGSRVLSDFAREQAQAQSDLALRSVLAGGQEASRGLNDITSLRSQGYAEQGQTFGQTEQQRQARLQEQVQNAGLAQSSRIAGLNELNTLLGLPQVQAPGIQSFFGSSPTGVTDAFGLNLAGQNAKASLNNQMKGSQLGALSDLGSAFILK